MDTDNKVPELQLERRQRDQALACAIFSLIVALALVLSNVGVDHKVEAANMAILNHKRLLAQNQAVLRANQAELDHDLMALERILGSKQQSRP